MGVDGLPHRDSQEVQIDTQWNTIVFHHKDQSLFLWELKSMKNVDMESCYCMYDTGKEEQGMLLDRRALPPRNVRKRKEN